MNNLPWRRLASLSVLASALIISDVQAQESFIEEIIVTATKRERNMQDIPVAVSAVTGDMMQERNIKDMRDLAASVPTLRSNQSQNSTTASFGIRGIGTSSQNFGLESSVGIYIDGVYRSRQSSIINNLADIETVEVLRGPQGTLFGKNTPSGALNIRTVAPDTDGANAYVDVNLGDLGLVNINGATNFSFSDNMAFRLTGFYGKRDGYVDQIDRAGEVSKDVLNDRDRFGGRLQMAWDITDRLDLRVIADYSEIDEVCCAALTRFNNFVGFGGVLGTDSFTVGALLLPVATADQFDDNVMTVGSLPRSTNKDGGISAEFNYDMDNMTFTSITAYRQFDSTDTIDADFSTGDYLLDTNIADQKSFSQELRLSGDIGDSGSWVLGGYYFTQELNNTSTLDTGLETEPFFAADPTLSALRAGIDGLSIATGGAYPLTAEAFPVGAFATDDMRQDHESYAVFGQVDFPLGERFLLTAGARYTKEKKDMDGFFTNNPMGPPLDTVAIVTTLTGIGIWAADPAAPGALDPTDPANVPGVLAAFGPTYIPSWGLWTQPSLAPQADLVETIDDDQVTGTIKLSWFMTDAIMAYASYGTGYKSGGTNTDRIDPVFDQVFDAETSKAAEIGVKMDFEKARLNLAFHNTQIEDLQTNAFSGNGFNLQNAGNADTYGAEVDFLWVPVDSFRVETSYAYNVAEFEDFENGTCWVATPFQSGVSDPGQTNPLLPICNRTGDRVSSNPEHNLFASATKDFRLGSSTTMYLRAEVNYISDTMTDGNNDPLKLRPSFTFINARAGVVFENLNTEIALWGRNLSDERFYETVFDVPVQGGKLNAYPHEPATYGVQIRANFD